MKTKYILLFAAAAMAGCVSDNGECPNPRSEAVAVTLPVESLGTEGKTRAAVEQWNGTAVSLAYRGAAENEYTKTLGVVIETAADQVVDMGLEYPVDNSLFYVRGYHPVAVPQVSGVVSFDISKGDVDVMWSQEVSGSQTDPIIADDNKTLRFKHLLTRITFRMQCAQNQSYPARISAVCIEGHGNSVLRTHASLNLMTNTPLFQVPGMVLAGFSSDGHPVPADYETALEIDAMIQPGVPFDVYLLTSLDESVSIDFNNGNGNLGFFATAGGEAGKRYVVNLTFNGSKILADGPTIVEWDAVDLPEQVTGGNQWW